MRLLTIYMALLIPLTAFTQSKTAKQYYDLSIEKVNQGDVEGAFKLLAESLKVDSTYEDSYVLKGYIYYQLGKSKEAIIEYDKLLKINPKHKDGLKNRSLIKMRIFDLDGAIQDNTLRLELEPKNPVIYFDRAYSKGLKGDVDGAISDYSVAIQLDSLYKEAYANRGVIKINKLTSSGIIKPKNDEVIGACSDLTKAQELEDNAVDDMIYIYCGDYLKALKKKNRKNKKKKK